MTDYALGVITPFAAIAALALALGAAYLLASLARKLWASVHGALVQTVEMKVRDAVYLPFGDRAEAERVAEQEKRRKRIRKANLIRDALVQSPGKIIALQGLGFHVLIARSYRTTKESK